MIQIFFFFLVLWPSRCCVSANFRFMSNPRVRYYLYMFTRNGAITYRKYLCDKSLSNTRFIRAQVSAASIYYLVLTPIPRYQLSLSAPALCIYRSRGGSSKKFGQFSTRLKIPASHRFEAFGDQSLARSRPSRVYWPWWRGCGHSSTSLSFVFLRVDRCSKHVVVYLHAAVLRCTWVQWLNWFI